MSQQESSERAAADLRQEGYEHQMAGRLADAIICYKQSIDIYPTAETCTLLGWVYSMIDLYDDAMAMCRRAIELDPGLGNAYNDMGAYLIELDRWEEAVPWLEEATKAPRYATPEFAYTNLGRVFEHLGDYYQALGYFNRALAQNLSYLPAEWARNAVLGKLN